jgi:serine/threonine protein kinase/WD40 repeat protein
MVMKSPSSAISQSEPVAQRGQREPEIPEHLGDYRILREIGRGGMGVVYEAVQESLGRQVALKVLSQHRAVGSVELRRFEREAKAAALLHHTNIVPVFGVGEDQGVHYFAMQYIEGQSLETVLAAIDWLRGGDSFCAVSSHVKLTDESSTRAKGVSYYSARELRIAPEPRRSDSSRSHRPRASSGHRRSSSDPGPSPADLCSSAVTMMDTSGAHYFRSVARLIMQAAEALAYAHLHGVLHRDIKPANLLLDLRGTVWVTDFGLAKAEGSDELTSPGDVVGTLRYVAPERFRGKADSRCDIYSLGLTLYEMLTLAPAFTASHRVEFIDAILNEEPRRPRSIDPLIPLDLETIVLKSIAKNPSDRFSTADELARELERFVEGRPILSRRLSSAERVWRWCRRNRATALLILLAASLTSILAVGSTLAAWKFREQLAAMRIEEIKTRETLARATTAERAREAELGRTLLGQARAVRYSGQPGRRSDALFTLRRAAQIAHEVSAPPHHMAELRDEVIAALALSDDHPSKTWTGLPPIDGFRAYNVKADRLVHVDRQNLIHVCRLSDRSEARILGAKRPALRNWPTFVPGGRFLEIQADSSRWELWDLEQGDVPAAWPADVRCVTNQADGKQVAALRSTGELCVYDLPPMALRSSFRLEFKVRVLLNHARMSLSQSGRQLALICDDKKVVAVFEAESGRVIREIKLPTARVWHALALNRNGGLLAIGHDRAISVFDTADGEQLALLQGHLSLGIFTQFQPGGDLLASSAWDGTTRVWDPIRGRLLVTLQGRFDEWLDDGSSLVLTSNNELIKNPVAAGSERRTIDYRTLGDRAGAALYGPARVSYSPDGRMLAMAARPEGVRIVRTSDGVGLALLPIGHCDDVLFMPSGDLLTYNERGLCRWPIGPSAAGGLRIGPPEPLAAVKNESRQIPRGLATTADGRQVGAPLLSGRGSLLLDPDHFWRRKQRLPHLGAADLAISPDGRWACSAGRGQSTEGRQVKVWDASTGESIVQLPLGNARVAFSDDSRWLGVGGTGRYRFFRTGSWAAGAEIEHGEHMSEMPLAFHPNSRVAAILDSSQSMVRVVDPERGVILATFDAPDQSSIHSMVFSPDGCYLAVTKSDQRVDLWDLSSIRDRLDELGLADGLPDFRGGATTSSEAPRIDSIEVRGVSAAGLRVLAARLTILTAWNNLQRFFEPRLNDPEELAERGNCWSRLGQRQLAVADYRASLSRRANSADAANELAWCLASIPGDGDPQEALKWARMAVSLRPSSVIYQNTYGAALYRADHIALAVEVLQRNVPRNKADAGYDWVFLAMCKKRLGQEAQARLALARAREWRAKAKRFTPAESAEFQAFIHEAESLLAAPLPDFPGDVFAR